MNKLDIYVSFIILIKVIFICLAIVHAYLKLTHRTDTEFDKMIVIWKEQIEFVFVIFMSCLLIYLFNPRTDRYLSIDKETRILLFLFGIIMTVTAKWRNFFDFVKFRI